MSATHVHVDGIVLIIFLLFASLVVLLGSSVYILHSDIEITLMDNVSEQLEAEGFQFAVEFHGRDGIVSGSVSSESERKEVLSIAKSIEGVRSIEDKLEIMTPATSNTTLEETSRISGITKASLITNPLDEIITSAISKPMVIDPEIEKHVVTNSKKENRENLTEMTEKPIVEEMVIQFKPEEERLSAANEVFLSTLVEKLKKDPLLFIEMSSFHAKSGVAIKRTESIKAYFVRHGVNVKHFDVLWHDSKNQSKVQLKLFYNE